MSERLTQGQLIAKYVTYAYECEYCGICGEVWTCTEYDHIPSHLDGCPCDPANVVVSRALLQEICAVINTAAVYASGRPSPALMQRVREGLFAALGEEATA